MSSAAQPDAPHQNGTKTEIPAVESLKAEEVKEESVKEDSPATPKNKSTTRVTRSRSRTPQKLKEARSENITSKEANKVSLSLKKIDECVNGHNKESEQAGKAQSSTSENNGESTKQVSETEKSEPTVKKRGRRSATNKETPNDSSKSDKQETKETPNNSSKSGKQEIKETPNDSSKSDKQETKETLESETPSKNENDTVEMDPLVLASDEPDPELQFDENSDLDSGKGSPALFRCKTRRSHTRNIPTPKTPKSTDSESDKNSAAPTPTPENLNDTNDSVHLDQVSIRAQAGSDSTIAELTDSILNYSRDNNKSLSETIRTLSGRKAIRPLSESYRQTAFRNNFNKSKLNTPLKEHDTVDRIVGIKRKRSTSPEERKKFKAESPGFVSSYLLSPLSSFKNRFWSDVRTSTPKLTGYKDSQNDIHEAASYTEVVTDDGNKKAGCAIM